MKITILILLFSTISGFSQEFKFNLFLKDSCSNKIESSFNYHLEKNGTEYNVTEFDNGTIIVPTKGEYKLIVPELEEEYNVIIDKLINSDTLNLPKIVEKVVWPPHSFMSDLDKEVEKKIRQKNLPTFWICNEKCNGLYKSFYSNGNIRFSGNFENGLAIGEFIRYYQNGIIKETSIFDNDGFLTKKTLFDENGEIKKE
jgi:antitoxin component YwqK of YwqJK toxin-antitoxin module